MNQNLIYAAPSAVTPILGAQTRQSPSAASTPKQNAVQVVVTLIHIVQTIPRVNAARATKGYAGTNAAPMVMPAVTMVTAIQTAVLIPYTSNVLTMHW